MNYLKEPKYYEDLYDLHTINECLRLVDIFKNMGTEAKIADELKHLSDSKRKSDLNIFFNQHLISIKLSRYKNREPSIEEWIEKDREKQDTEDNTPPPKNILCDKCNGDMKVIHQHLSYDQNPPYRVEFIFECKQCKARKAYYDNGERRIFKKDLCEKCSSETKLEIKDEGDITKWITSCTSCDFENIDIHNTKESEEKWKNEEKRDKTLLKKYRDEFCMEKKEAEEFIRHLEETEFALEVYEYELAKYEDPVYEEIYDLKKINIIELEKLLIKTLNKDKFKNLDLEKPVIGNFIEVQFTVTDANISGKQEDSTLYLKKIITKKLVKTNWRLISNISYRLGYLVGTLRGYERDEDIIKLLKKKDKKAKLELDPEKLEKHGHSRSVRLAKMSAEFKSIERIRMKKFKDHPNGFFLKSSDGNGYSCKICYKTLDGSEAWWIPEAILCKNCHNNIMSEVIPKEILENRDIWFRDYSIKDDLGLHIATIRKKIREGELIGRDLKDKNGKTYFTVFMAEDNIEFLKNNPSIHGKKQRWHYVDENGEVIWL